MFRARVSETKTVNLTGKNLINSYSKVAFTGTKLGAVRCNGWLGSRVVSMLDSGAEGPGFKSQLRRRLVTVLGKLFTPIMPLFTKQQNW